MVSRRGRFVRDEDMETIIGSTLHNISDSYQTSRPHESERGMREETLTDGIRKHNLAVQLVNSVVNPNSSVAQVHPKVIDHGLEAGQFPKEMELPRKLEWFGLLDSMTLDRLLAAYEITVTSNPNSYTNMYPNMPNPTPMFPRIRTAPWFRPDLEHGESFEARLLLLFEYLGVCVSEYVDGGLAEGFLDGLEDGVGLGRRMGGGMGGGHMDPRVDGRNGGFGLGGGMPGRRRGGGFGGGNGGGGGWWGLGMGRFGF